MIISKLAINVTHEVSLILLFEISYIPHEVRT